MNYALLKIVLFLFIFSLPFSSQAQVRVAPNAVPLPLQEPRYPQGVNPSLYAPNDGIYDWKIKDTWPDAGPCHFDERAGMWVGNCNGSLDTPGFSITVPRQIRR